MKKTFLLLFCFTAFWIVAQENKSTKIGLATLDELKMTVYEKDSTAKAVVLYEHANTYLDEKNDYKTRTDYYFRIKILNKSAVDLGNISIEYFDKKQVIDIKGVTHNLTNGSIEKKYLLEENIFTNNVIKDWNVKRFALPNIQEGSVIEYQYSILSNYLGLADWSFQSDIPKIKSEYDAAILGNYQYNVRLIGFLTLTKNNPSIKKNCVHIDGLGSGDCAIYSYGMTDIPAFIEEEYMLSKVNYVSRIAFDLISYTEPSGIKKNYTTTWKEADFKLKSQFFNNQTNKKSYFEKILPSEIVTTGDELERAKKTFTFIQNHFTWNSKNWTNDDAKIKDAFEEKSGNVSEINLSLYNSLKATDLDVQLVVLSTRDNGLPTKLYPIIYDYNYVIVKLSINGSDYFLDATDKFLPFGMLPIRTINGEGRVINFDEEGSWILLKPSQNTSINTAITLQLSNKGEITGNLKTRRTGYYAADHRKKLSSLTREAYISEFESENDLIEVINYTPLFEKQLDFPLEENFDIKLLLDETDLEIINLNPFILEKVGINPFKLKERVYPVNFGNRFRRTFSLNMTIPENYEIVQTIKSKSFKLDNDAGIFILKSSAENNLIKIFVNFSINKSIFNADDYAYLKEFFNQIIISQRDFITLKRKP